MRFLVVVVFYVVFIQGNDSSSILDYGEETSSYVSVVGDPGMKNPNSRFGFEAWNFCNEVGMEAPNMGSPRMADCAHLHCLNITGLLFSIFFSQNFTFKLHFLSS